MGYESKAGTVPQFGENSSKRKYSHEDGISVYKTGVEYATETTDHRVWTTEISSFRLLSTGFQRTPTKVSNAAEAGRRSIDLMTSCLGWEFFACGREEASDNRVILVFYTQPTSRN